MKDDFDKAFTKDVGSWQKGVYIVKVLNPASHNLTYRKVVKVRYK